jgi:hypothetical protein
MQMPTDKALVGAWVRDKLEAREQFYRGRNAAMLADRRLLLQVYRQEVKGQANVVSAEPRNAVRLALDIMTQKPIRLQALIHDQEADEKDRINDFEQFAAGIWREVRRNYRLTGNRELLRDLDWFIVMGGFATMPLVSKGPRGPRFTARILDPLTVFPEYDDDGMNWVAHSYKTTLGEAMPRFLSKKGKKGWHLAQLSERSSRDEIQVVNAFWIEPEGVFNALVVDGVQVKEATLEPQFGDRLSNALLTGPASGHPHRHPLATEVATADDELAWTSYAWESLLAPARLTYSQLDSLLSYSAEIVRRNAHGRYVENTRTGQPRLTTQQWRNAEKITMMIGETIIPIPPSTSPSERNELLSYLTGSLQRSTLSFTAFGALGLEISGVTLDSLNNATQSVLNPFKSASEFAVSEMLMSLTEQYRLGAFKKVSLEVRGQGEMGERLFIKDFDRKDLPKTAILMATQPLSLPDTTLSRITASRTAVGDNRQILSEETLHEKVLQDLVPDSHLERDRIDKDKVRNSPQADALSVVNGLREVIQEAQSRGDRDMAMLALTILKATLAQFEQQIAGAAQRIAGIDAQRQAQDGGSITEPSPQVAPPEASGAPPDAIAGASTIRDLAVRRARNTT